MYNNEVNSLNLKRMSTLDKVVLKVTYCKLTVSFVLITLLLFLCTSQEQYKAE